jgi:periplasmic protein CpxP/Spy
MLNPSLKRCLLVLAAAGLISIGATFAAAQDNAQDQAPPQQNGMHRHGPPDPAERTKELTKKLKLNADQQAKVQSALEAEHSQMESLHQDSSLSREDRRSKMMDIHKTTDTQIRGLLDADQQKKWDEMQTKREQWMQGRRQGGSPQDGGQAPPPQQ